MHIGRVEAPVRKVIAVFIVLIAAAPLRAQVIYFRAAREVVEQRLQKAAKTNDRRLNALKALFTEAGCSDQLMAKEVRGSRFPNIICILPGDTKEQIVVGGHYDKVDAGDGVMDNWSGSSLLPTLYESLKQHPRKHTVVFIGFAAEEQGLVGSKYYVNKLRKEERALIHGMVNLDTIALGPLNVWVNGSDKRMVQLVLSVAQATGIPIKGVNVEMVGTSDSQSFRAAGVPVIDFHSITAQTLPVLHSRRDNLQAANVDEYYRSYQLIAAFLAHLDTQLPLTKQ
jgi:Zn-dependent M28 family amino/carboxypeptidase